MTTETLIKLVHHNSYPCISIIFPTHKVSPERYVDHRNMRRILDLTKNELVEAYCRKSFDIQSIVCKIENLVDEIDFNHLQEGMGLFISPEISQIIKFPFQVNEKIVINNHFSSRDLFYLNQTIFNYHILALYRKSVHLFSGEGDDLKEVFDDYFPAKYEDDREYNKPSRMVLHGSTVLKQFEREESDILEKRTEEFYRSVDNHLNLIRTPLLISGNKEEINDFIKITRNKQKITGKLIGSFEFDEINRLEEKASSFFISQSQKQQSELINRLNEDVGRHMVTFGLNNVWKSAFSGNCLELCVEKDFSKAAYLSLDGTELKNRNLTRDRRFRRINDMVDKIIHEVLDKGGKIYFVDNDLLKGFDRLALRLRYPE